MGAVPSDRPGEPYLGLYIGHYTRAAPHAVLGRSYAGGLLAGRSTLQPGRHVTLFSVDRSPRPIPRCAASVAVPWAIRGRARCSVFVADPSSPLFSLSALALIVR